MARADSTIRVNIIGDAKSLTKATGQAEGAIGGMNKKLLAAGAVVAGAFAVDQVVQFGNTALKEADRVADATGRIESQLGDLAPALTDAADGFSKLGASEGDMLELEAKIIDVGTALQISDDNLAAFADDAASTAAALALITDTDADTWIDQIGKAASGSERALRALGVSVTDTEVIARALAETGKNTADALTEGELAAARLELILEKLAPRIEEVRSGEADLEQQQAELQAKWETLTGKIGEALEGPLNDLLSFILTGIAGWEAFAAQLADANSKLNAFIRDVQNALAPLARLIDLLSTLATFDAFDFTSGGPVGQRVPRLPTGGGLSSGPNTVNVNVQGGSPEAIEQAVRNAVNTVVRRSGALEF